ncbi:MAG: hypothetical protein VW298_02770, partial [Candidatus Woesearchaeota archaeon]
MELGKKYIKKSETLTNSLIKRNKTIIGSVYTEEKDENKTIHKLLIISNFNGTPRESIEHILNIQKDADSLPKNNDIRISCILLDELWNSATRGQTN